MKRGVKQGRLKRLEGLHDDPAKLIARATAKAKSPDPMVRREAASDAHLAVFSAVARRARRELRGTRDYQSQINKIAEEIPMIKPLAGTVYRDLHVKCYYRGEPKACTRKAVEGGIELARTLVDIIGRE